MNRFVFLVISLVFCMTAFGQQENKGVFGSPVIPGPKGVYVYTTDTVKYEGHPFTERSCVIYREDKPGAGFKRLVATSFPVSAPDLEKRIGKDLIQQILQQRRLRSVEDLYAQLKAGRFDTLGIFASSADILQALGALYIDPKITGADASVSYRLEFVYNGNVYRQFQLRLGDIRYTEMPVFKKYKVLVNDSSLMVTWYALKRKAPYAGVYLNSGVGSKYAESTRQFVYERRDTLFVSYSATTTPGSNTSLFMRAQDLAGNPGLPSDTVRLLSLRFADRISIQNLAAKDTLGSVWLKWDAMPSKAWCSGIEILKSRYATSDYIVIDTVPVIATTYRDSRTMSGTVYYYQLRPLLYDLPQKGNITPAVVNITTKAVHRKIPAPQSLTLGATKDANIRLSWMPNADLDIFAYYILRGTSRQNMEVISPAIQDTVYIDTVKKLNTGITYLYAVAAMNMSMEWSDTSAAVAIQSPLAKLVTAPGGIQGRPTAQGIRLSWNDVSVADPTVTGYVLFRRKKGEPYFTQINKAPLKGTFYVDSSAGLSGTYEYGCSSIDAWNHVSILSPLVSVPAASDGSLAPPVGFYLRNVGEGIEIKLPEMIMGSGQKTSSAAHYVLYRRLAIDKTFKKIGELPLTKTAYTDKSVVKDQLYAYTVTMQLDKEESNRTPEKSIRRK